MITMQVFYSRLFSPEELQEGYFQCLQELCQASMSQIREFKVASTWEPWGAGTK